MPEEEVKITYETLFELLRREKSRDDLQKLPPTFLFDVVNYLKDKIYFIQQKKDDLFDVEERKTTEKQIDNIKMIIRDLYERREKKIMSMALNKSRTKHAIIDTSSMLREEYSLFEELIKVLDSSRIYVLQSMLEAKLPANIQEPLKESETAEEQQEEEQEEQPKEETTKIKITGFIEKFIGTDLKQYGPYEEGEEIDLPKEIAQIILKLDKGSEINV